MEDAGSHAPERGTITRRATLAKGAAAGALAWTTPIVLSTSANAGTTCTGKCIPPAGTTPTDGTITGTWDTDSIDFTVSVDPFTCPCAEGAGGTSPATVTLTGELTRTYLCFINPTDLSGTPVTNGITFGKRVPPLGAFDCYEGSIIVTVTCRDRSGDAIRSTATVTVSSFAVDDNSGTVFTNRQLSFGNFVCAP